MNKLNKEQIKLLNNFINICKKGWIKGNFNGIGNSGLTFEKELNKKYDDSFFPDYYGIEIKCTTRFSRYPLPLFKIAFDAPSLNETDRLTQLYGSYDYEFNNIKIINEYLRCNKLVKSKSNYFMNLNYHEKENSLFLEVYDFKKEKIEELSYININSILSHLNIKLKNLAIIHASKKNINGNTFFRYYKIDFYTLKSNDVFLDLVKNGIIIFNLVSRVNHSGYNKRKLQKFKYCN